MFNLTSSEKKTLFITITILVASGTFQLIQPHKLVNRSFDYSKSDSAFHRLSKINSLTNREKNKLDSVSTKTMEQPPPSIAKKKTSKRSTIKELLPASININNASEIELQKLPRIGPAMSKRIINYRNKYGKFKSKNKLLNVKGIGKKTLEKILPYITLE